MSSRLSLENTLSCTVFVRFEKTVCYANFLDYKDTSWHQHVPESPPSQTVFMSLESTVRDGSFSSLDASVFVPQSTSEVPHA
jgi:hypothetical protein